MQETEEGFFMVLIDFYRELLQSSDEELLQEAADASQILSLKAGELAIKSGTIPTHVAFPLHGVLRGVANNANGKDITDCIVFRTGSPVMPDSDFTQPASISLEALEYSELVLIPIPKVQQLLAKYPGLMEVYQRFLMWSVSLHRDLKIALYQYTAAQRYEWFLRQYPGLIDRIPHKYIASLLNMTPVTLSNVRKNSKVSTRPVPDSSAQESDVPVF